jgi:hypothetical protein
MWVPGCSTWAGRRRQALRGHGEPFDRGTPSAPPQGSPCSKFKHALARRNLLLAWAIAAELPKVPLADALSLLLLTRDEQHWRFEKAAPSWHAQPRGGGSGFSEGGMIGVLDLKPTSGATQSLSSSPPPTRATCLPLPGPRHGPRSPGSRRSCLPACEKRCTRSSRSGPHPQPQLLSLAHQRRLPRGTP